MSTSEPPRGNRSTHQRLREFTALAGFHRLMLHIYVQLFVQRDAPEKFGAFSCAGMFLVIYRATSAVGPGAATEAVQHHGAAQHGVVCWRLAADPERCSGPYLATRNVSDRSSNIGCRARRRYGGGAAPRCGAARCGAAQGGLLASGRRS